MAYIANGMPPTPTPSVHSPSRRPSLTRLERNRGSVSAKAKLFDSPSPESKRSYKAGPSLPKPEMPPTPPDHDESSSPSSPIEEKEAFDVGMDQEKTPLAFQEPVLIKRSPKARRPASVYPTPSEPQHPPVLRKNTDPSGSVHHFVSNSEAGPSSEQYSHEGDMDAYSSVEFDPEENMLDGRAPTLSFLTTSTVDSTTGTPSSIAMQYGIRQDSGDGKDKPHRDHEPRIRTRSTTGRSNAYSSAESSMASGAYSYHAYADNNIYHPHPPPLPVVPPLPTADRIGLGITSRDLELPPPLRQHTQNQSPITQDSEESPSSSSFAHRPWKRDVVNRLRSDSASTSLSEQSGESPLAPNAEASSSGGFAVDGYQYNRLPWETEVEEGQSEALALVNEGKEKLLDKAKIEEMGGLSSLTEESMASLGGITHLLLSGIGSELIDVLPQLLASSAPTLVVLDLSSNDLTFLPEALRQCTALEELRLSDNPLRALPIWMAELVEMRMLVVDGCLLQSLPQDFSAFGRLHTLCARRNRFVTLPSWLCLLGQLETLKVDDNPFAQEWQPIVAPILSHHTHPVLANVPARAASHRFNAAMMRSTPSVASIDSNTSSSQQHGSDNGALGSMASAAQSMFQLLSLDAIAEDQPHSAPGKVEGEQQQAPSPTKIAVSPSTPEKMSSERTPEKSIRKMRSVGDLLDAKPSTQQGLNRQTSTRAVHGVQAVSRDMQSSASSSTIAPSTQRSWGAREGRGFISSLAAYDSSTSPDRPARNSTAAAGGSGKMGKWGFLRKMSMNRIKSDKSTSTLTTSASANLKTMPPMIHSHSDMGPQSLSGSVRPKINHAATASTLPSRKINTIEEFGQMTAARSTGSISSQKTLPSTFSMFGGTGGITSKRGKRKSFLPVDEPPSLNVSIPSTSPFMPTTPVFDEHSRPMSPASDRARREQAVIGGLPEEVSGGNMSTSESHDTLTESMPTSAVFDSPIELDNEVRYRRGLESIKSYLRDMFDLSRAPIEPYGGFEVVRTPAEHGSDILGPNSPSSPRESRSSVAAARRRRPTLEHQDSGISGQSLMESENQSIDLNSSVNSGSQVGSTTSKKFKDDKAKRARIIREIYETERTYVRGLGELVAIYVKPASQLAHTGKSNETVIPTSERKVVFGGIESILTIHRDNLLPALERAVRPLLEGQDDEQGQLSTETAHKVGEVFRTYIAYMKQYSSYINNFDNALSRMKTWSAPSSIPGTPAFQPKSPFVGGSGSSKHSPAGTPNISSAAISVGIGLSSLSLPLQEGAAHSGSQMTTSQKKRVKAFLKKCREHPMHSQINLESYLLLPIQRVPRYKLLLEDLAMYTLPQTEGPRDTLDDALNEIASLASLMNEEKRDAESRLRLFHWQQRITSKGPSPLVQPHRKLILDGALTLIRLVKKSSTFVEVDASPNQITGSDGEMTITPSKAVVPVEYIAPEPMDRNIMLILCTDLLALVQQRPGAENGWEGSVDLFNVLRMATLREPASIVHGNVLRVVDNKSIYYFNGGSHESILSWCRAINSVRRR